MAYEHQGHDPHILTDAALGTSRWPQAHPACQGSLDECKCLAVEAILTPLHHSELATIHTVSVLTVHTVLALALAVHIALASAVHTALVLTVHIALAVHSVLALVPAVHTALALVNNAVPVLATHTASVAVALEAPHWAWVPHLVPTPSWSMSVVSVAEGGQ